MSDMPVFIQSDSSSISEAPPKKRSKTIRLNIDLNEVNRDGSIVLNYVRLLNEETARRAKGDFSGKSDTKADLKKLKLSDNKYQSYAELGAGYDDEDSFIDNTDAFEECLPENMDTKYGGYYINSGELELKKTISRRIESSSSSESSESNFESSSEDERPQKDSLKREHDSSDSKKLNSDGEKRKRPKIILAPMRDGNKMNSNNNSYPALNEH